MKLTIIGPEGFNAVITKTGQYYVTRNNLVTMLSESEAPPEVKDSLAILASNHTSISRAHLKMDIGDIVTLTDLRSRNGSFLDGNRFEQTELTEGKYQLQLGNLKFNVVYEK